MNLRTIVAAIAGAIVMFLFGFLVFGLLLRGFYESHMSDGATAIMLKEPRFVFLFLWQLIWAWLIAFIFDKWATISTFAGGAKAGAIILGTIVLGVNFSNYAFLNMYKGEPWLPMIVDVLVCIVMGALTGGVIGLVLGKMNKGASAD